jgi:hypothetical protein
VTGEPSPRLSTTLDYASKRPGARRTPLDVLVLRVIAPLIGFSPWTMVITSGDVFAIGIMLIKASPTWLFGLIVQLLAGTVASITRKRRYVYPSLIVQLSIGISVIAHLISGSSTHVFGSLVTGLVGGLVGAGGFFILVLLVEDLPNRPKPIR